jgi:hypothetical protein
MVARAFYLRWTVLTNRGESDCAASGFAILSKDARDGPRQGRGRPQALGVCARFVPGTAELTRGDRQDTLMVLTSKMTYDGDEEIAQ